MKYWSNFLLIDSLKCKKNKYGDAFKLTHFNAADEKFLVLLQTNQI